MSLRLCLTLSDINAKDSEELTGLHYASRFKRESKKARAMADDEAQVSK